MLIGRDPEQRLIESLLDDARKGASAALVIRGEAGIGKTALLDQAAKSSRMRVLRCRGLESEHDLPFAGLEQLLRPVRELVERLPAPQASALRSAFGLGGRRAEDRLILGLATLGLLAEATEEGSLLCLVDDLQWLDAPSSQALLFAARRLEAEGVLILFAVRDDPANWFEAHGMQQLTLAPLSESAARQVVRTRRGALLNQTDQQRLLREAAGNPLALLELPAQEAGGGEPAGLEAAFRARVMGLPRDTRRLLLLAAAGDTEDTASWIELARLADLPPTARQAAVQAGLIGDLDAIAFRHPLVRSAVYSACSRAERAVAHDLLASASSDPLARASHLAAAAQAPDERVAMQLEEAAMAATQRGAFASAASALVRAAELSIDSAARAHRLVTAAQAHLDAGNSDAAHRLADEALASVATSSDRAALANVRGALELQRGTPGAGYDVLVTAAHAVAREDPARALELQAHAITAAFIAGWPGRAFAEAHEFVKDLPPTGTPYEEFLRAFLEATVAVGATAKDTAREALLLDTLHETVAAEDFRSMTWAAFASAHLGDLRRARELSTRAVALARSAGSSNTLPLALLGPYRAFQNYYEAEESATEGIELTRQLGQENLETCFSGVLVRCLAVRGRVDECRELGEATLKRALAHGLAVAADDVRLGLAELELSLARGAAARETLEAVSHPLFKLGATLYLVEAEILSGDREPESVSLDDVVAFTEQAQDPYMLGALARARALLAPSADIAETLLLEALSHQTQGAFAFERARTALAYGEFLRRAQRRTDARVQLRDALATFEGLNAPLWADRARAELEATGITARKRDPSTLDSLTPQELRIAKLVAGGASNRDVASQLFLSQKTVEYHLRKVFLKLGVSSRVELARKPLQPAAVAAAD